MFKNDLYCLFPTGLDDFEFSQNYLFFWDKVERANYFLHTIADSYRRSPKEEVGGRLVSFLLEQPISDGGQWDMVVNLIEKHGISYSNTTFNSVRNQAQKLSFS